MYYFKKTENYDAPLWIFDNWEDEYPNMALVSYGRDALKNFVPDWIKAVEDSLDEIAVEVNAFVDYPNECAYKTLSALFADLLPRLDGKPYSTRALHELKEGFREWDRHHYDNMDEMLAWSCGFVANKPYETFGLHGSCQGDYITLVAPADTAKETVERIETEYFQLGNWYKMMADNEIDWEDEDTLAAYAEEGEITEEMFDWDEAMEEFYTEPWNVEEKIAKWYSIPASEIVVFD